LSNRKKIIFVAGHQGMVGSAILKELKRKGFKKIITISKKKLDLTNQNKVNIFFKKNSINHVYLAAAKVGGIMANKNYPFDFLYQNTLIQFNVIQACLKNNVERIMFLGSSCIYPKNSKIPIVEESLLTGPLEKTNEAYAIAKISGIKLCESVGVQFKNSKLDTRCVMPTNIYGPGDNFTNENSHMLPALIKRFHEAKINMSKEVIVWGSGKPKREYLYVDDLASIIVKIMNISKKKYIEILEGKSNFLNIGSNQEESISNIARIIKQVVGFKGVIRNDLSKPDGVKRKKLNLKLINKLGWKPKITLKKGIKLTYKSFLQNY
jgi:GDP-L-fucose synthase